MDDEDAAIIFRQFGGLGGFMGQQRLGQGNFQILSESSEDDMMRDEEEEDQPPIRGLMSIFSRNRPPIQPPIRKPEELKLPLAQREESSQSSIYS